jgi:hypothetical protein
MKVRWEQEQNSNQGSVLQIVVEIVKGKVSVQFMLVVVLYRQGRKRLTALVIVARALMALTIRVLTLQKVRWWVMCQAVS